MYIVYIDERDDKSKGDDTMTIQGRLETISKELDGKEAWMCFDALNDESVSEMTIKGDDTWGICEQFNAVQVFVKF